MLELHYPELSIRHQCQLLGVNRSSFYYQPKPRSLSNEQRALLRKVDEVYTAYPFYS